MSSVAPQRPSADARVLLLGLLLLSLLLFVAPASGLAASAVLLVTVLRWSATSPWRLAVALRPFLWLLPVLFGARLWEAAAAASGWSWALLVPAAVGVARVALVVAFAAWFGLTCPAASAREALTWLLRPVLRGRAHRVATLLSLTLRTIPELRLRLRTIRLAQKARRGPRSRRLPDLLQSLATLLRGALVRSDRRAQALALRGHESARPLSPAPLGVGQLLPLLPLTAALVVSVLVACL